MQAVIPSVSLSIPRSSQQRQIEDPTPQIEISSDSHVGESSQSEASLSETVIVSPQPVSGSPVLPQVLSSLSRREPFSFNILDLTQLRRLTCRVDDIETFRWKAFRLTSALSHFLRTRYKVERKEMVHDTATDDLFRMILE